MLAPPIILEILTNKSLVKSGIDRGIFWIYGGAIEEMTITVDGDLLEINIGTTNEMKKKIKHNSGTHQPLIYFFIFACISSTWVI
jgi:hypothetical protein